MPAPKGHPRWGGRKPGQKNRRAINAPSDAAVKRMTILQLEALIERLSKLLEAKCKSAQDTEAKALIARARTEFGPRVVLDVLITSGKPELYRAFRVVEQVSDPVTEMLLTEAKRFKWGTTVGDTIKVRIDKDALTKAVRAAGDASAVAPLGRSLTAEQTALDAASTPATAPDHQADEPEGWPAEAPQSGEPKEEASAASLSGASSEPPREPRSHDLLIERVPFSGAIRVTPSRLELRRGDTVVFHNGSTDQVVLASDNPALNGVVLSSLSSLTVELTEPCESSYTFNTWAGMVSGRIVVT